MQNSRETKYMYALTKLRTFSHRLKIEAGRWHKPNKIPYQERLCNFCSTLGDEYHFTLECVLFNNLRKRLIPHYYRNKPSMTKFLELLNSENNKIINNLSMYVFKAFNVFKKY